MSWLYGSLQSIAVVATIAGIFLMDTQPQDEVYLGVGPRVFVKHNEPSPAQAALEDILEVDSVEPGFFSEDSKPETLTPGKNFVPQSEPLLPVAQGNVPNKLFNELEQYQPRPGIRITERDLIEIMQAIEDSQWSAYSSANPKIVEESGFNQRLVETSQGTPIIVSRPSSDAANEDEKSIASRPSKTAANPRSSSSRVSKLKRRSYQGQETLREIERLVHPTEVEWGNNGLRLSGSIRLLDGLIFNPEEHQLTLFHNLNGLNVQVGEIDIETAEFYIAVNDASGTLLAELRTLEGELKGVGRLPMVDLPLMERNTDEIENLIVHLNPQSEYFEGQIISAYSFKTNIIPMKDAQLKLSPYDKFVSTDEDGLFKDTDFYPGSETTIYSHASEHWSSIERIFTSHHKKIRMFSDKDIHATYESLFGSIHPEDLKSFAVIKGKVNKDGLGKSGAAIDLVGDFSQPIYYDYFLPRKDLTVTTDSGEFMIFTKLTGPRPIEINVDGLPFPSQWVELRPGHVSQINIDLNYSNSKSIQVFDAFDEVLIDGLVQYDGVEDMAEINGGDLFLLAPETYTELEVNVDAGDDYPITRFKLPSISNRDDWPLMSYDSFEEILGEPLQEELCPIVVWFRNDIEEVGFIVDGQPIDNRDLNLYFFNSEGEVVNSPELNGGVIVDENFDQSLIHVIGVPLSGAKLHSRYIFRDSGSCQSLKI